jgi:hypothetical protein
MEEEEIHCEEINSMCSSLGTESACEAAVGTDESGKELSCFWLKEKTNTSRDSSSDDTTKCMLKV